MLVYVLSKTGHPLMPTDRGGRVRYLLNTGQAEIVRMKPFTIKLQYDTKEYAQPLYGGTDPGRSNIGNVVLKETGEAVYADHVTTRNKDIPDLVKDRASHRRASRRGERKCRQRRAVKNGTITDPLVKDRVLPKCEKPIHNHYIINTEARFANRKRPEGWLTPTATQLLRSHLNIVDKICSILPVKDWTIEINRFDFMKMEDGSIRGVNFQNGRLKGYKSVKEYIDESQNGVCPICGQPIEHYHHIVPLSKNGSDTPENIVGLCEGCHAKVHTRKIKSAINKIGKEKKYAAQSVLNQIISYLHAGLVERFGEDHVHFCNGYETKVIRERSCLHKDHYADAMCIASVPLQCNPYLGDAQIYEVKQFRRHDRAIINCQWERTYRLNGEVVAKNRKPRFEQEGPSLQDFLAGYPPEQRRAVCSQLTVTPSLRRYNNKKRECMPGCVFLYGGKRYVLSGQITGGKYLRAVGDKKDKKTNFNKQQCRIIQMGVLVYL